MHISFWGLVLLVSYVTYHGVVVNRLEGYGLRGDAFRVAAQTALDITVMVLGEKYIWVGAELFGLIINTVAPSTSQRRALQILDPAAHPLWRAGGVIISGLIWGLFQYIR